ncbi:MAG: MBL fold metallo-hydrolase [Candidatus Njordarchaeia archaeon]
MFLAPNLYKVPKTRGANVYIIEDTDGLILVDTGFAEDYEQIIDFLSDYLDADEDDIKMIIITHGHTDHTGALPDLISATEATTVVHRDEVNYITQKAFFGKPFKPSIEIIDDTKLDVFGGLEILHTPGHTDGSITIYKKGFFLISGDTIIVDKNGKPAMSKKEYNKDISSLRISIGRLAKLEFNILLPGHGRPLLEKADSYVKKFYEEVRGNTVM